MRIPSPADVYANEIKLKFRMIVSAEDKLIINSILKTLRKSQAITIKEINDFVAWCFISLTKPPKNCYTLINMYDAYVTWLRETHKVNNNHALDVLRIITGADRIEYEQSYRQLFYK